MPITALKTGQYTVVVADNSRKAGVNIKGFGFFRHTSAAFRGTVTWTVNLGVPYLPYRVTGAPRTRPISFNVLP